MPRAGKWAVAAGLLAVLGWSAAAPARAVTFDQQAERLQRIYAFLLDFRPVQAPLAVREPELEVALDLTAVPRIDNRVGSKDEAVDAPAVIPRPRVRYHGGGGLMLGAGYTPPVRVNGYRASLAGVEAQYRLALGALGAGLRAFATAGTVEGPVTDPEQDDRFELTNQGADLLLGLQWGSWMPYLGAGRGRTDSTLTVRADEVELRDEAAYGYVLGGITLAAPGWRLTLEQYRTEAYLEHFTLGLSLVF